MTDTGVIVASKAPMAVHMSMVDDETGTMISHVIHGNRHHSAVAGMGITKGVDPVLFDAWMKDHPEHGPWDGDPKGLMHVLSEDELKAHHDTAGDYGWEPGLAAADTTGHAEGSLETGPASTVDMAAHSFDQAAAIAPTPRRTPPPTTTPA